jgi:type I restriction enzyme S subunit
MSEWQECTIGEVITLQRGFDITKKEQNPGSIPVVSSSGINSYHDSYKVEGPGVVIGRKGTLGTVFFLQTNFWPHDTSLWVKDFKGNDPRFVYYFLKTIDVSIHDVGSSNPTLNRNHVHLLPCRIPPLPEQKAIASVLSSLDDKIDLLHRQNKTLEAMAETLFRQWFVEEADESWVEGNIPDEFDFTMGQSPTGSSFNEEKIGTPMFQGNADFTFRFPSERVYTTDPKRFAERFDTLISVRAPVGAQNMASQKCCIGRGVAAFRYKSDSDYYTYTYYKLMSLMDEIKKFNDEGTVFGSIGKKDFENMEVIIPPSTLVVKYENKVKPLNDRIISNSIQIEILEKKRDLLLPKFMSGDIKLSK